MLTVKEVSVFTTEVNRSKFITYLVPISEYKGLQEKLKTKYPKANHVVYALRSLNAYDQVVENSSDDGEPKGCAGVPALNVLRGEELINCAVLIVRYFGGIKLGTGGMARAYALSVKNVTREAELAVYEKQIPYEFTTDYSQIDKTLYALKQYGIVRIERDYGVECVKWRIYASEEKIKEFTQH
ncbi:YigZ family protein [Sulfurovum sp.]|uniref:IMPACT family protein n=1 Tax=Sulfurovum sp. TaxID=1969726 RepID=UPI0025CB9CA9|nr:YigZ family protein [Sulfurovum sp.]